MKFQFSYTQLDKPEFQFHLHQGSSNRSKYFIGRLKSFGNPFICMWVFSEYGSIRLYIK
jgi:hypothetical protein